MSNHQYYKIMFSNIVSTSMMPKRKVTANLSITQKPGINANEIEEKMMDLHSGGMKLMVWCDEIDNLEGI